MPAGPAQIAIWSIVELIHAAGEIAI